MGCFNDPARKVCGGGVGGWLADTNYRYTAHWGGINYFNTIMFYQEPTSAFYTGWKDKS